MAQNLDDWNHYSFVEFFSFAWCSSVNALVQKLLIQHLVQWKIYLQNLMRLIFLNFYTVDLIVWRTKCLHLVVIIFTLLYLILKCLKVFQRQALILKSVLKLLVLFQSEKLGFEIRCRSLGVWTAVYENERNTESKYTVFFVL